MTPTEAKGKAAEENMSSGAGRVVASPPPLPLRSFFSRFEQSFATLPTGERIRVPLFFWGDGVLGLTGPAALDQARAHLRPLGHKPLVIPGPHGPAALAGVLSPSYLGSSAGPYRSFFFGFFVQDDQLRDPRTGSLVPGFKFVEFYDSTRLSTAAGRLWHVEKVFAPVKGDYRGRIKRAWVEWEGRPMVRLSWHLSGAEVYGRTSEKIFRNFPHAGRPGARLLVCGRDVEAPFDPALDELYLDPTTPMGATIARMRFVPARWTFTQDPRGVYFLPGEARP
jgi:hypothetical protein